jgi:calcineurin-like phosphoesterase family protein
LTPQTWLISDTHWKHENIIRFCCRPYDCDARMVVNWHRYVLPADDILHLGDLALGISRRWGVYETMLATLTGRRFLLRGNHDRHRANYYQWLGFEVIDSLCDFAPALDRQIRKTRVLRQEVLGRRLALSHVPIEYDGSWDLNLHGHIHNKYRIRDRKWVNLSIEVQRYRPVSLRSVVETCRSQRTAGTL